MSEAILTEEEYVEKEELFEGFCSECQSWTRDGTDTDARLCDCPVCGEDAVFGASEALLEGLIYVKG